jgi:hypothetical protein
MAEPFCPRSGTCSRVSECITAIVSCLNLIRGTQEEIELDKSGRVLAQHWLKFQQLLPKGHASKVQGAPPSMKDVVDAVATANDTWKKNREESIAGKAKEKFGILCQSLESHKEMLAVVPQGDKYVSLITGSLSSIVKVPSNLLNLQGCS